MKQRLILAAAALGSAVLLAGCSAYSMPTASMEPTLHSGDRVIALRQPLMGKVQRGDLVVFRYPVDPKQTFVKRVVGMPGDHVKIVNKQLILNGKPTREPYAEHLTDYMDSYRDNFPSKPDMPVLPQGIAMLEHNIRSGEVVVPANNYFVLGDNRDNSLDSRYWGFVPASNVIGVAVYIYAGHPGSIPRAAPQ